MMISHELEVSLHLALVEARQQRHDFVDVEDLLLALLDNPSASKVLTSFGANIEDLRRNLSKYIKDNATVSTDDKYESADPTLGFQRVLQRAINYVQGRGYGSKEVMGADMILAILGEKDSHAVYFLRQQGMTQMEVKQLLERDFLKVEAALLPRSYSWSSQEEEAVLSQMGPARSLMEKFLAEHRK